MASPGLSRRLRSRPKEITRKPPDAGSRPTRWCRRRSNLITEAAQVESVPNVEPTMGHFLPKGTAWYTIVI